MSDQEIWVECVICGGYGGDGDCPDCGGAGGWIEVGLPDKEDKK